MIKLERGICPAELTQEVLEELTKLYAENKDRDVWNSPKVKAPLKEALLNMSHQKCSYCECMLDIEAKDVTIDHFLPKSTNPDKVVEWENLLPACLRCNRQKNSNEDQIVNPCVDDPKEFLALYDKNRFRLKGIDDSGVGKNTILAVKLNDPQRVMVPRLIAWEKIEEKLEEIYEDLQEVGYQKKYKHRLDVIMQECTEDNDYAAVKATNLLNDEVYQSIKKFLEEQNEWSFGLQQTEDELKKIALDLV